MPKQFLILLFLFLAACKTVKPIKDFRLPENKGIISQVNFVYLTAKAKVNYQDSKQSFKSTVEIRAKKDSAIWVSFRPALGVEVVRVLITQDSIKVIDRTKQENYAFSFAILKKDLRFDLRFAHIEALLTGNLIDQSPATATAQEHDFLIISQQNKTVEIKNYVGNNQKIHKVWLQDAITNNQGRIDYADFQEINNKLFPFLSSAIFTYLTSEQTTTQLQAEIKYSKVTLSEKPLRFPF